VTGDSFIRLRLRADVQQPATGKVSQLRAQGMEERADDGRIGIDQQPSARSR